MNPQAFIFIGRSGCGKGTQAELLSKYLKTQTVPAGEVLYIQTGDEFRRFIHDPAGGSNHTTLLSKKISDAGDLQPEFLAVYMWVNVLVKKFTGKEHLIFDGVPRKLHEATVLHSVFGFYGIPKPTVIYINVSNDWSVKHLMARKREDDVESEIRERLSWFDTDVVPAIEYYRASTDYSFVEINGERSVEEIHQELVKKVPFK
jgi:adenylate kinase